jgi:hypothetical protein
MTVAEVLEQIKALSPEERKELMQRLGDALDASEAAEPRKRSLRELKGLGKEMWEGVDIEQYLNELREEPEKRL